jgi:hypothetical protein
LGNPQSNNHLCPFNVAFIQRSRIRFVQHSRGTISPVLVAD